MGSVGTVNPEAWRALNPKYQRQTASGVYFWSGAASWQNDIDEKMYNKLPVFMKKAVIYLENSKTADGNHATIYYVDKNGVVQYYDEYGLGDFYYGVKQSTDAGNVADWEYNGTFTMGQQLKRKGKK